MKSISPLMRRSGLAVAAIAVALACSPCEAGEAPMEAVDSEVDSGGAIPEPPIGALALALVLILVAHRIRK